MLSREGPKAATADVNGDGLTDIYIGGTPGHPGQLYFQTPGGKFKKSDQLAFKSFMDFEDVAVLFFDYDRDGDMDLLVCPGGNNIMPGSRQLQLRLFKNDGKGNFTLDANAFPSVGMDVSVAIAEDFNHDGFPDLFIGSRNYPMIYGKDPQSFLFINDGKGHFIDIAATKNKDISSIGMVTGAVFADVTGDQQKELIIVGEWMYPKMFSFNGDHFEEVKTNLNQIYGWWQTVYVADLNNDGKLDLVLGNIGENFTLHPDKDHPVKLWLNDFDQNGNLDKVLTQTIDGKDMPVFLKRDLESQLPIIKKNNLKHKDYATKSIQELFSSELISHSQVKEFNYASSCVCLNKGNGIFEIKNLPVQFQLSCMNSIQFMDLNNDGYADMITGGNQLGFLPQFERLDGSFGDILINDGKGNFIAQPQRKTGFNWRGMVRDIKKININGNEAILVLQNDEYPQLYFRSVNGTIKKIK